MGSFPNNACLRIKNNKSHKIAKLLLCFAKIYPFREFRENLHFREFLENFNFRETRKSRKFDLAKLAKFSRNMETFSRVSFFAKILKRVSSKSLTEPWPCSGRALFGAAPLRDIPGQQ